MSTDLKRIRERALKEPKLVFTSLYHHVTDVDNLRACYDSLAARKATGMDGVTNDQANADPCDRLPELLRHYG